MEFFDDKPQQNPAVAPAETAAAGSPTAAAATPKAESPTTDTAALLPDSRAPSSVTAVPTAEEATAAALAKLMAKGKDALAAETKRIDERTAAIDKAEAEGLAAMRKAAAEYHAAAAVERQKAIDSAKKTHRAEQAQRKERLASLQRGGHIWEQVGEYVDASATNKFATKSTERMRHLLGRLKVQPNLKQVTTDS